MATAMAQRRAARANPLLAQARAAAQVRYSGEEAQLSSLAAQTYRDLLTGASLQEGAARGMRSAADASLPVLNAGYGQAASTVEAARAQGVADTSGLGSAADPFRAGAAREAQAAKDRVAQALVASQSEIQSRKTQAEEGRQFGLQQLARNYQQDSAKIRDRAQALESEKGAYIASTFGDLQAAQIKAEDAARSQASQDAYRQGTLALGQGRLDLAGQALGETGRHNAATEQQAAANANARARGKGGLTPTQSRNVQSQINRAWSILHDQYPSKNPKTGKMVTRAQALTSLKAGKGGISDPTYAQAAFDLVTMGTLGSDTYHQLIGQGYKPPRSWMPRQRRLVPLGQVHGNVNAA